MERNIERKHFAFTIAQAQVLLLLVENQLTDLELHHKEKVIEKDFYNVLHKYLKNRTEELENGAN